MADPKDLTDDELQAEWSKLAVINVSEITEEQRVRFIALDNEGYFRKYGRVPVRSREDGK